MEGSLKRILKFKVKSSKLPMMYLITTALSPRRVPPAELLSCVTILVYIEGIDKKHPSESCYPTYQRSGAEHVVSQSPCPARGEDCPQASASLQVRAFFNVRKQGAQHVFSRSFFLIFLYIFLFPFSHQILFCHMLLLLIHIFL